MASKVISLKNRGHMLTLITKTAALSSSSLVRSRLHSAMSRHRGRLARSSLASRLTFSATAPK